ncbi:tetratricopeptide repeat protein [Candidatus Dependentiae bacterium]|nr:tetratricopeptide repeat protein [Candidatus Dependentiae bacterium]
MKNLIPGFIVNNFKKGKLQGKFKSTVMFIDIVGFTDMTQRLIVHEKEGIEVLTDILNDIFGGLINLIYNHNGWIGKFEGDAFTVFFNDDNFQDHYQLTKSIQDFIKSSGRVKTDQGTFRLNIRIGVGVGDVTWRILITESRNIFYFKGAGIEDSYKAKKKCKAGEIYLSNGFKKILSSNKKTRWVDSKISSKITYKKKELLNFIPEKILNFTGQGEFRDVVSIFVSFDFEEKVFDEFIQFYLKELTKYSGYLNKLDYTDKGPILLTVFGAPFGLEHLVFNALDFCLSVQKKYPELAFGLTRGTVYAGFIGTRKQGEYTIIGDEVNLSARLMEIAKQGEILTDAEIFKTTSGKFSFENFGNKKLKGFKERFPVYRLMKKEPGFEQDFFSGPLIGRKTELKLLIKSLDALKNGKNAGIVYIDGDPGIGKSKLVHAFFKELDMKKYYRFICRNDPVLKKPFNPFIYFLTGYFNLNDDDSIEKRKEKFLKKFSTFIAKIPDSQISSQLIKFREALGSLLNLKWEDSLFEKLDAETKYNNMIAGLKLFIKGHSLIKPVIIEFEDAHWSDLDSQGIVRSLTINTLGFPILILIISRYLDDGKPFRVEGLSQDIHVNSINLGLLSIIDLKKLVNTNLEYPASNKLLDIIQKKSEYNPFFIEQIILFLKESGVLKKGRDNCTILKKSNFKIPRKINNIIISRIDRLSESLKRIIKTASVIGREFSVLLLSRILKNEDITDALEKIENESIWLSLSELHYLFKHILIRDAVYEMQLRKTLRKLHLSVAHGLEKQYKGNLKNYYQDLGFHYEKGGDIVKAMKYYRLGAELAEKDYKNQQTIYCYNKLLEYAKKQDEKCIIRNKLAPIYYFIGNVTEAEKLFKKNLKALKRTKKLKLLAETKLYYSDFLRNIGKYDLALELLEDSKKVFKKLHDKSKYYETLSSIGSVYLRRGMTDKALKHFNKAYEYSIKEKNIELENDLLGKLGVIEYYDGNTNKAYKHFKRMKKLSEKLIDPEGALFATVCIGNTYYARYDFETALEYYKKAMFEAININDISLIGALHNNIGGILYNQGNFQESIKFYEKLLELSKETNDKFSFNLATFNLGNIFVDLEDFEKGFGYYTKSLKISKELGDLYMVALVLMSLGKLYRYLNDSKNAKKCFKKSINLALKSKTNALIGDILFRFEEFYIYEKELNEAMKLFKRVRAYLKDTDYWSENFDLTMLRVIFKSFNDKNGAKADLLNMLKSSSSDLEIALLNYELFNITGKNKYKSGALKIYKKLYRQIPFYKYKFKIKELESSF